MNQSVYVYIGLNVDGQVVEVVKATDKGIQTIPWDDLETKETVELRESTTDKSMHIVGHYCLVRREQPATGPTPSQGADPCCFVGSDGRVRCFC